MRITIGIISYLPDEPILRKIRIEKLNRLIESCNTIFNLPLVIIAQNWKEFTIDSLNSTVFNYNERLGIVGARRELRRRFLDSDYDYLVMLDDDCELLGTPENGKLFIDNIIAHPNMGGMYKTSLLKLFAISKETYKLVDFPEGGGVEDEMLNHQCFEDLALIKALLKFYSNRKFIFNGVNLNERSDSANDKNSTGGRNQRNKHEIGDITRQLVKEATLDNEGHVVGTGPERVEHGTTGEY